MHNIWVHSPRHLGAPNPRQGARRDIEVCESMRVLGVGIDSEGTTETAWRFRLQAANGAGVQHAAYWRNRRVPLRLRAIHLRAVDRGSRLFCGGGWTLSRKLLARIAAAEDRGWRRMLNRPRAGVDWPEYYRNCRQAIDSYRRQWNMCSLVECLLRSYVGWMGHLARADPDRNPAAAILRWRGAAWWSATRRQVSVEHTSSMVRCQAGRPFGDPEDLVVSVIGEDWKAVAGDREDWATQRTDAFIRAVQDKWHLRCLHRWTNAMPDDGRDYPRFFADFSWASAAHEPWTRPVQISSTRGLADIQSVVDVFELELDLFEWKSAIAEDNRYDLCTAGWSQEVMDVLHEPDSRWEDFYADVLRISSDPRVRWLDEPFRKRWLRDLIVFKFQIAASGEAYQRTFVWLILLCEWMSCGAMG